MNLTRALCSSTGFTLLCLVLAASAATAQEPTGEAPPEDALFAIDELETLVAPVAHYPDTLLTQILVASTYPLEVVLADRFTERYADIAAAVSADLAV